MNDVPSVQPTRRPGGLSQREILATLGGILAGLVLIGIVYVVSGRNSTPPLPPLAEVNRPAPQIALPGLDGQMLRLEDYRGRVVLVNFWATWCEPCKLETPALQEAHRQLEAQGLTIIGINLRKQESDDVVIRAFVDTYGVTYPVVLDVDGEAARQFQISPIPTSYFIDPAGNIRYVRVGELTLDEVALVFQSLQQQSTQPQGSVDGY